MYEYICLIIATLMWSFVGICSKVASAAGFSANAIAFSRFFFGAVFLLILMLLTKQKVKVTVKNKWIWIAVIGKCLNYLLENIAFSMGFSHSGIIVWPTQTIFIAIVSALFLKEKMNFAKIVSVIMCCVGIVIARLETFEPSAFAVTMLFICAGVGAAVFVLAQKMLVNDLTAAQMNFSVFFISSIVMAVPLPFTEVAITTGAFNITAIISLVILGLATGIAFYLNSVALKKISVVVTMLISNSNVLLTILWSYLFMDEPVSVSAIIGSLVFISGIMVIYLPELFKKKKIN